MLSHSPNEAFEAVTLVALIPRGVAQLIEQVVDGRCHTCTPARNAPLPPRKSAPAAPVENPTVTGIVAWPPNATGPVVDGLPALEITGGTKAEQLRHLGERASVCVKCAHLAARRHVPVASMPFPAG